MKSYPKDSWVLKSSWLPQKDYLDLLKFLVDKIHYSLIKFLNFLNVSWLLKKSSLVLEEVSLFLKMFLKKFLGPCKCIWVLEKVLEGFLGSEKTLSSFKSLLVSEKACSRVPGFQVPGLLKAISESVPGLPLETPEHFQKPMDCCKNPGHFSVTQELFRNPFQEPWNLPSGAFSKMNELFLRNQNLFFSEPKNL